jgi:predicted dehydrogenase
MSKQKIQFGVIGCGLMGREFASSAGRWCHLQNVDFQPEIVAACDVDDDARKWFEDHVPSVRISTPNYQDLLDDPEIDAIYCAVPHNLHEQFYIDIIQAGKHLLGEKPFGIDREANDRINEVIAAHPDVLVRCSSEIPYFPGAYQIMEWVNEDKFGEIIEVDAGFWHSSDLNPRKPINWKRMIEFNGEYGCMGDLGMHALHLPLRFGWMPERVHAQLTNIMTERLDGEGNWVPCETWDNAVLACDVDTGNQQFPMTVSTKRIAPGHANTWFLRIWGTKFSAKFSTKQPKNLQYMPYEPGGEQAWRHLDVPYRSAYDTITGSIFEFGLSDSILQMFAAFCDELIHGDDMQQPLSCATPLEAAQTHTIFTAALESNADERAVAL